MIKKSKFHHKDTKNTKVQIEDARLSFGSSRPLCLRGEYPLCVLCVFVVK